MNNRREFTLGSVRLTRSAFFVFLTFLLASMASTYAVAADACQPLATAVGKLATTPTHIYATTKDSDGKLTTTEMIYANGEVYGKVGSNWMRTNLKTQEMVAQTQYKQKNGSCRYLKDESVAGETAAIYSERSKSGEAQAQLWISKSSGLLLREEIDLSSGGKGSATHISMRYEYKNVQPPKI